MITTTLKSLTIVAALLAGGTSLAMAQNGPATGGEHPVAGGAAGGPYYGPLWIRVRPHRSSFSQALTLYAFGTEVVIQAQLALLATDSQFRSRSTDIAVGLDQPRFFV
jgi:hypothetical protein